MADQAPPAVPAQQEEEEAPRFKVQLAVYDLSQGMARQLGPALLGMEIEAIYHTGIVVYGKEHFFGGGIVSVPHEEFLASYHMQPFQTLVLGETEVSEELFDEFLREISPRFTSETYDLMRHNCNNFSNEAAMFLLGEGIPPHILALPEQVFSSPMGMLLRPAIEQMQGGMRQAVPGFHFESYEGGPGQHHHVNVPPPLVPTHASAHTPLPAVPVHNPWANLASSAAATASTPVVPPPTNGGTNNPPAIAPAPAPQVLAANDKPLLSVDPPAALKQTVSMVVTKLKALATGDDASSSSSLLSPADLALLDATEEAVLKPLNPLPAGLQDLLLRTLSSPWPAKAEFFTLSLLRPLFLRPAFPTPALLTQVVAKVAAPETFASKASVVIALSGLSNVCAHKAGRALLLEPERAATAADAGVAALRDERPAVRQMAAAFLANLSLGLMTQAEKKMGEEEGELPEVVVSLLLGTMEGVGNDADATSAFRRLLCAGRLVKENGASAAGLMASLGFDQVLRETGKKHGGKVQDLATEILSLMGA